jgi:general secretion pathway protein G
MNRKGFTLVEILIVVIILGILAAIVIPQFTEASNDARESALKSDLQTVRSQLELYKVQHLEHYPDMVDDGSGWAADTDNLVARLTSRTNAQGEIMGDGDSAADFPYGPYLQKFPSNPFASDNASTVATGTGDPEGDGDPGWFFATDTGKFSPNDADHDDL